MSKKKLLLLGVFVFLCTFIVVLWVLKGTEQTKIIISNLWTQFLALPSTISSYVQGFTSNTTGALATLGGLGGATTGALAVYKQLRTTKQQATEAIGQVSGDLQTAKSELSQAKTDLEALRTQAKSALAEKEAEIQGLKTQLETANTQLQTKSVEVQNLIGERNLEAQQLTKVQSLQVPCRYCQYPVPPGIHFCPNCGKELIVA